ncbi:glycosyltransferase family 2 protein [Erythrobacter sp. THAF29]|uniref:glycosyltransferase family 2 protein n=1 Tax=Erythrobacter sp. THAF29 TaxID=2587851 RepID=UPI0012A88F1E|nr:glycosyltransferase family 2 protein [Erythrobacter sp. THAF29]QFT77351.1 Chondroitin synthase [Erythrobacter sp. THAF29]
MTAATPKVTLAMPVFNGSNYIRDALDSILAQTFTDFELVVCDNASTDETCAIVQEYAAKDPRIVLIRNPKNLGASANYNLGFEHGRGRYLKWCAHDDQLSANFLAECVKVLDASPDVALAFGSTRGITPTNEITTPTGADTPSLDSDDPAMRFRQAIELAGTCFPIFGLFRRENLAKSTLHRPYYGSDRAVLAEAALMGKFVRVEDAIFYNREHEQRSINIDDKVQRSLWQTGKKSRGAAAEHLNLTRHLFEIASRHGDIVSPWRLYGHLLGRSLRPRQLGRYGLELANIVSPALAGGVKRMFVRPSRNPDPSKAV